MSEQQTLEKKQEQKLQEKQQREKEQDNQLLLILHLVHIVLMGMAEIEVATLEVVVFQQVQVEILGEDKYGKR